ncbi:hypothetical protein Hanom_Chr12g01152501 [Helianthus anomalus]
MKQLTYMPFLPSPPQLLLLHCSSAVSSTTAVISPPLLLHVATVNQPYPYVHKQRASPISDEEVPATTTTTDDGGGAGDGKLRQGSPWQRMKWMGNMVRLLIMVVFYVGDEVGSDQVSDTAAKQKGGGGGWVMQKKGKRKSMSF